MPVGIAMQKLCAVPESGSLQPVNDLNYLVENAERCYRLARGLIDPDFTRHLAELGQEYAAQAIERGADPATLPGADEWRRLAAYAAAAD
jgi:hypothetical protein